MSNTVNTYDNYFGIQGGASINIFNRTLFVTGGALQDIYNIDVGQSSNFDSISKRLSAVTYPLINITNLLTKTGDEYATYDVKVDGQTTGIKCNLPIKYIISTEVGKFYYNYTDYRDGCDIVSLMLFLPYVGAVPIDVENFYNRYIVVTANLNMYNCTGTYIISSENRTGIISNYIIRQIDFDFGVTVPFGTTNAGDIKRNAYINKLSNEVAQRTGMMRYTASTAANILNFAGGLANAQFSGKNVEGKSIQSLTSSVGNVITDYASYQTDLLTKTTNNNIAYLNHSYPISLRATSSDNLSSIFAPNPYHIYLVKISKNIAHNQTPEYKHLMGLPYRKIEKLSNLTGYTEIGAIHMEGDYNSLKGVCTDYEYSLLHKQITSGIIL